MGLKPGISLASGVAAEADSGVASIVAPGKVSGVSRAASGEDVVKIAHHMDPCCCLAADLFFFSCKVLLEMRCAFSSF
jgi:hypothetical protein